MYNECMNDTEDGLFWKFYVIGSGDFKQLPPVPNRYLGDDGGYCFRSAMFDIAFPHHIQLLKVKI